MTLIIKVNEEEFHALSGGDELSFARKESIEYAATFPKTGDFIKIRFDNVDYGGVLTDRNDTRNIDNDILINIKLE